MTKRERATMAINTFGIALLIGIICNFGCAPQPAIPSTQSKSNVALVIMQGSYYKVLLEDEGRVTTKTYLVSNVTFMVDLKPEEKMWIENDPVVSGKVIVHIHSVKIDIKAGREND